MDKVGGAVLGEELHHALPHHAAEAVDLADRFDVSFPDGFQRAEVLGQQGGGLVSDVADAKTKQQLVQIVLLGIFDGVEKVRCALLLELFQRQQLLEGQVIEVCRRVDKALVHQLGRHRRAQTVDVHGVAGGKMDDVAQRLGRALGVDAAQGGFVLKMDDRCPAGRADFRHLVGRGIFRMADDADDLRDDVAGLPHLNDIADAKPELADESSLWRVARATVVPARKTGSKQAVGVSTPVRPTATSMLRRVVSLTSGGYLKAMAHRGNLLVEPICARWAKSLTLMTAPSMSKSSFERFWPICSISRMASSMSWTIW